MDRRLVVPCLVVLAVYVIYRRSTRASLSQIRGPKPASYLLGNLPELYQSQVGEPDFRWQDLYGDVIRLKGILGEDQLMVTDPKALQWIFATAGYDFPKQPERRAQSLLLNGRSIVWAEGDAHKRHRRILNPGFGVPEARAFLSVARASAESMSAKWMDAIQTNSNGGAVVNVPFLMSRATLDAIVEGRSSFDVRLGSVHDPDNTLARSYSGMLLDMFGTPSKPQLFVQEVLKCFPTKLLEYWFEHSSNPRLLRARQTRDIATAEAKDMVTEKAEFLLQGKGSRDIFTLLVKANMDAEAKDKLSDEELYAQMRILLIVGHESTSHAINWTLMELARNPEMQTRLRAEIRDRESAIRVRGDSQFTVSDLEGMPYLTAFIKEGLRYHPTAPLVHRMAGRDTVLPLSRPIATNSGKLINEIPVPEGTRIVISISAYNRNKELWGEDAHVFNPDRWLDGTVKDKKESTVGVYANLMTFGTGHRSCLGWRFALIEIQAFVVEIISKFEISLTEKAKKIRREACLVMVPTVEGEIANGVQLPLAISVAPRGDDD
ncbi:cytochrome P450 [Scleroderma yunnanense]